MRKSQQDIWAGISFIFIAVIFGVQYGELNGVSRVFPEILISLIILGGVYYIIKGFIQYRRENKIVATRTALNKENAQTKKIKEETKTGDCSICSDTEEKEEAVSWSRIGIISVLAVLLVFTLEYIGFFVSSTVFILIAYLLLGEKSSQRSLVTRAFIFAVPFIFLVWVLFVKLLNVPTPTGILF